MAKTLFEKLSKEKLLGYFLILWGASFLLSGLGAVLFFLTSGFIKDFELPLGTSAFFTAFTAYVGLELLQSLISAAAGVILIVLGYKIIKNRL